MGASISRLTSGIDLQLHEDLVSFDKAMAVMPSQRWQREADLEQIQNAVAATFAWLQTASGAKIEVCSKGMPAGS